MTINPIDSADGALGLIETWQKWCIDNQCDVNPFCTQAKKKLAELIDAKCATPECSEFEEVVQKCVSAIEYDLSDRGGFKAIMSDLHYEDRHIYDEIIGVWKSEVSKAVQAAQASKKIKVPSYSKFQKQLMRNDTDYPDDYKWICDELERLNGCKIESGEG